MKVHEGENQNVVTLGRVDDSIRESPDQTTTKSTTNLSPPQRLLEEIFQCHFHFT